MLDIICPGALIASARVTAFPHGLPVDCIRGASAPGSGWQFICSTIAPSAPCSSVVLTPCTLSSNLVLVSTTPRHFWYALEAPRRHIPTPSAEFLSVHFSWKVPLKKVRSPLLRQNSGCMNPSLHAQTWVDLHKRNYDKARPIHVIRLCIILSPAFSLLPTALASAACALIAILLTSLVPCQLPLARRRLCIVSWVFPRLYAS